MKNKQEDKDYEHIILNEYIKSLLDEDDERLCIIDRVYRLYRETKI